jgi:hypothetical protein
MGIASSSSRSHADHPEVLDTRGKFRVMNRRREPDVLDCAGGLSFHKPMGNGDDTSCDPAPGRFQRHGAAERISADVDGDSQTHFADRLVEAVNEMRGSRARSLTAREALLRTLRYRRR